MTDTFNVTTHPSMAEFARRRGKAPPIDGGGGSGDDADMEARLSEVEKAIVRLDASLPTLATKDEVQKGFSEMVKWIVGTGFAGLAVFITVMTFVLNNAVPKVVPAPVVQQPPIIINVPSNVPAAAAPAPAPAVKASGP